MPEEVSALRLAATEASSVDNVGNAVKEWRQQLRNVRRVVLQVGVLNHHEIAGRGVDPGAHSGALALVALVDDQAQPRNLGFEPADDLNRLVDRTIVNYEDLSVEVKLRQSAQNLLYGAGLVVGRHNHGDAH